MREQCGPDVQLEGYDFAEDLRTFQAALTWFRKRGASLMPGEVLVNARSLYVIGYSRPTKGVSFRVKHCCSPDPRATLQDIFTQRSACHWRFDFHVSHISRSWFDVVQCRAAFQLTVDLPSVVLLFHIRDGSTQCGGAFTADTCTKRQSQNVGQTSSDAGLQVCRAAQFVPGAVLPGPHL